MRQSLRQFLAAGHRNRARRQRSGSNDKVGTYPAFDALDEILNACATRYFIGGVRGLEEAMKWRS